MSHLKLQKVLYYIQSYHLAFFEKKQIFSDQPEAWVNGPVYRVVYDEFKQYGVYNPIKFSPEYDEKVNSRYQELKGMLDLTEDQWNYLDSAYNHFAVKSHEELVIMTHRELPWNEARKGVGPFDYSNKKISFDTIYNYYHSALAKNKK